MDDYAEVSGSPADAPTPYGPVTQPPPTAPEVQPTLNALLQSITALLPMLAHIAASATIAPSSTTPSSAPPPPLTTTPTQYLPPGAKAPAIEKFDGKSPRLIQPWIQRTRNILCLIGMELNSPAAVAYAASFLTNYAQSWFYIEQSKAAGALQASGGFRTFDEFAHALETRMGDPRPADKARRQLRTLKQTTSVKAYADAFQRLITYLPSHSPDQLRFDFTEGLKPEIRSLMLGRVDDAMDWTAVRDLAIDCDDVHMTSRRGRAPLPPTALRRDTRPDDPMQLDALNVNRPPSARRSSTPQPHRSPSPHRSGATSPSRPRLPKLTDAKRAELRANNGCFRCQKAHAGHTYKDCPMGRSKN